MVQFTHFVHVILYCAIDAVMKVWVLVCVFKIEEVATFVADRTLIIRGETFLAKQVPARGHVAR